VARESETLLTGERILSDLQGSRHRRADGRESVSNRAQVDADGYGRAGIRMPAFAVPLATYTVRSATCHTPIALFEAPTNVPVTATRSAHPITTAQIRLRSSSYVHPERLEKLAERLTTPDRRLQLPDWSSCLIGGS
jgi:hypothetical protein